MLTLWRGGTNGTTNRIYEYESINEVQHGYIASVWPSTWMVGVPSWVPSSSDHFTTQVHHRGDISNISSTTWGRLMKHNSSSSSGFENTTTESISEKLKSMSGQGMAADHGLGSRTWGSGAHWCETLLNAVRVSRCRCQANYTRVIWDDWADWIRRDGGRRLVFTYGASPITP